MTETRPQFVWIANQRGGTSAQIWREPRTDMGRELRVVFSVTLTAAEARLTLDELAKLYPCPKVAE